jgi:rhamnogalacturonan endolyase
MPTLMHDHTYRMGIAWQNTAYNQPPHLGYFLPDAMLPRLVSDKELTVATDADINWTVQWRYAKSAAITASYLPDGTKKSYNVPDGLSRVISTADKTVSLTGALAEAGDYQVEVKLTGMGNESVTEVLTIHVGGGDGIGDAISSDAVRTVYDLQGRERNGMKRGLNIVRQGGKVHKMIAK